MIKRTNPIPCREKHFAFKTARKVKTMAKDPCKTKWNIIGTSDKDKEKEKEKKETQRGKSIELE